MLSTFRDALSKSAGDAVTFTFNDGGSLGDETALAELIRAGAVEVIPMARSLVAREILALTGGQPVWRDGVVTDNGNVTGTSACAVGAVGSPETAAPRRIAGPEEA